MRINIKHIFLLLGCLIFSLKASAQFKEQAFSQNYADSTLKSEADTSKSMFSFKEFFGGVSHKRDVRMGVLFGGSTVFIGSGQIHNRDYWKLPIVYGGIAAGAGSTLYFNHQYKLSGAESDKIARNLSLAGTSLVYWGSLMDLSINYKPELEKYPARATIYSILLPGLGQIYNGEAWKIPIYWGGLIASVTYYNINNNNYLRYQRIYRETTGDGVNNSPIASSTAQYYRDVFRRYRDYSIVAIIGVYLLQVIDANVFAYMQDFEVDDNISMHIRPTVITPDLFSNPMDMSTLAYSNSAVGLQLGFRF